MSTDTIITLASMFSAGIAGVVLLFNVMNRGFDNMNRRFDDVNKRFDDVNKRLDDHGMRLVRIEDGYIEIAQRVSRIEGRIGACPLAVAPAGEAAQPAGS